MRRPISHAWQGRAQEHYDETDDYDHDRSAAQEGDGGILVACVSPHIRTVSAAPAPAKVCAAKESMAKKMLIDATHPEETRVVVVDGNKVDEFDFESINKRQLAGNIYLAKVTRVEPSLQAAFVDYGGNRHGFLAFSEIHPDYYQIPVADREALLAAEAASEAAEEEEDDVKPAKKSRSRRSSRSRSRKKKSDDQPATADGEAGTGETDGADAARETGDGHAEPSTSTEDAAAKDAAPENVAPENVAPDEAAATDAPTQETAAQEAAAQETAAEGTAADPAGSPSEVAGETGTSEAETGTAANDSPDDQGESSPEGPKSIAESAGAEDDETVSEPLEESAEDEAPKPKPRARRSRTRKPAKAEAEADAAAETAEDSQAEEAPAEEAAPEVDGGEPRASVDEAFSDLSDN